MPPGLPRANLAVMADIMTIENLEKRYGSVQAVDKLSFGIPEGVCFGCVTFCPATFSADANDPK